MLYATVRNRKISVKKPTTIPCNGKNVDFLTLDLDEDWDGIVSILCTFCNDYLDTKKQKKTVIETEETVTVMDGETVLSTTTTTDKEVKFEDLTDGEAEKGNTVTTTDTKEEEVDGKKEKTTTKTTTTVSYVEVSEAASVKRGVLCFPGDEVKVPAECVRNVGQLSVWLTGYSSAVTSPDDVIADPENFEANSTKVLTMATPDSFWELVENGEPDWTASENETADLYEQALEAVGNANEASEKAERIATDLANAKASGAFNGAPGKNGVTPNISIGTVTDGEAAAVTISGANEAPVLNFVLPRGKDGETLELEVGKFTDLNGSGTEFLFYWPSRPEFKIAQVYNGKNGYTPRIGVDYWTDADKAEIKKYIDLSIGDIEASLDSVISVQESYIAKSPVPVAEEVTE